MIDEVKRIISPFIAEKDKQDRCFVLLDQLFEPVDEELLKEGYKEMAS